MINPSRIIGYVLVSFVGLGVGYFAGREHLKYEIRTAVQTSIRPAISTVTGNSNAVEARKFESPTPSRPAESPPLELVLIKKGFKQSNPTTSDFENLITIEIRVKNLTKKDIRAFDGVITFTDLLDNPLMATNLAINEPVQSGSILTWNGAIKYNQFIDSNVYLKNEAQENTKIIFSPKKILFTDGNVEMYDNH